MRIQNWLAILCLTACSIEVDSGLPGSGSIVSEERQVEPFAEVELSGSIDVEVRVGEAFKVVVETDDNLLEYLLTEVDGGVLEIRQGRPLRPTRASVVRVTAPKLSGVSLVGSGSVEVRGVDAADFKVDLGGSGDISVFGETDSLSVALSGSGDAALARLAVDRAEVSVVGSGEVDLQVRDRLEGSITGSGDVYYRGQPTLHVTAGGSGEVRSRD